MTMLAQETLRLLDKFGNSSEGERPSNGLVPSNSLSTEIIPLIEQTFLEVNEGWAPGALKWMRETLPNERQGMMSLEEEINRVALAKNVSGLKALLREYKELMLNTVRVFRSLAKDIPEVQSNKDGERCRI